MNHFTDVRRWLKEDQRWKEWQNLEVRWIQGHNPDLVVLENGSEKERIDLTQFSYSQIPDMLRQKGFKMQGEL